MFTGLALVGASLQALAATTASAPATLPVPPQQTVREAVREVLDILQSNRLLADDDPALRRQMIRTILETLDCQALFMPHANGAGTDATTETPAGIMIRQATVGGIFAYLRIPRVVPDIPAHLTEALEDVAHGHYEGVVLDLRYTAGSETDADAGAQVLARTGLPIAILVNGGTVGAAELLADSARRQAKAVLVGQPTRGLPYTLHAQALASGDLLMLPRIETATRPADGNARALHPDVTVQQVLPRHALWPSEDDSVPNTGNDMCLQAAVDLLKAIHAFEQ